MNRGFGSDKADLLRLVHRPISLYPCSCLFLWRLCRYHLGGVGSQNSNIWRLWCKCERPSSATATVVPGDLEPLLKTTETALGQSNQCQRGSLTIAFQYVPEDTRRVEEAVLQC